MSDELSGGHRAGTAAEHRMSDISYWFDEYKRETDDLSNTVSQLQVTDTVTNANIMACDEKLRRIR